MSKQKNLKAIEKRIKRAKEIVKNILNSRGDYYNSTIEFTEEVADWINKKNYVTEKQFTALINIYIKKITEEI